MANYINDYPSPVVGDSLFFAEMEKYMQSQPGSQQKQLMLPHPVQEQEQPLHEFLFLDFQTSVPRRRLCR